VGTKEKKKTVLIVDDTKFMRSKLRNILECGNFKIAGEAEDGQQAVAMFERLKPDVVTMDITMPNMDGISSLKEIKKFRPEAKVIMISALGQKEKVRDSLVAGASDFILKPFVPEKVLEVITRIADR
jgi:two-component system chemotaxis response regulator CheY